MGKESNSLLFFLNLTRMPTSSSTHGSYEVFSRGLLEGLWLNCKSNRQFFRHSMIDTVQILDQFAPEQNAYLHSSEKIELKLCRKRLHSQNWQQKRCWTKKITSPVVNDLPFWQVDVFQPEHEQIHKYLHICRRCWCHPTGHKRWHKNYFKDWVHVKLGI